MATIKDVAKRAGVSTATVSYVINRNRYVSEELTGRVLKAIKELNFTPSKVARSLRRGKSSVIGLIMDDITNRFASQFTRGLENTASENQYSIIISDLQEKPENEMNSVNMLLEHRVEGIIYSGYGQVENRLLELYEKGLPVVVVDKPLVSDILPSVLIDNRSSMIKALECLKDLGHDRILYINGLSINRNGLLRAEAFREFMIKNDFPFTKQSVMYGDYTLEHGYRTTLKILEEKRKFSALICGDDLVAFGVMAALKSKVLRIPQDVAVVGFDDDPMAAVFDPSLTTIHYPMYEMGRNSFKIFHDMISGKSKHSVHVQMDTELVIRRSTDSTYKDYYNWHE